MSQNIKIGVLTTFAGSDSAYSLVNVVQTQLSMLLKGGYNPVLFVAPSFQEEGFWSSKNFEIRRIAQPDAKYEDLMPIFREKINDIDVMLCHDIVFLSQHAEWGKAVRTLALEYPQISWLHWQHSRGDHIVEEPCENSWYCYPNQGDLGHVAAMNKTTIDKVVYIPHPLDLNYYGWPDLAIRIAEDLDYPFADVCGVLPSRLDRQKQIDKAVRIYAGLKKAGKSVCFICADAYATGDRFLDYKKDCLEIAKEQGLTDKEFVFLGENYEECRYATPRPVVKALYEMGNLFILPSNSETSSLVAMEAAMAGNLIVLNSDFSPIHHLYKKALTMPFGSITEDRKYYREVTTADGQTTRVQDPQLYWDDQSRSLLIPIIDSQITLSVKKQQFRDRWPSRVFTNYLNPLIKKVFKPRGGAVIVTITPEPPPDVPQEPKDEMDFPDMGGDSEITAIITTLDNLPILKKQVRILSEEVGNLIVVNNGAKDGTKEWLDAHPLKGMQVIHRDNFGAGPGRNAGLALWDKNPTPYTLMVDGGILPPYGGAKALKDYLLSHPDVEVVSPEIVSCYTTNPEEAMTRVTDPIPDKAFTQRMLTSTAYGMQRASAWRVRFSEEGPFGEAGWGVDDNDMAYRWDDAGVLHHDFTNEASGWKLYRRASGSFKRLFEETGIWPTQYGSVYEKRCVKMYQDYPAYLNMPKVSCIVLGWNEFPMIARCVKRLHEDMHDKIYHEIIVVDNGSTDGTKKWMKDHALRQYWGDTTIDTETGEIIKKTPENEATWTGNFITIDLPENMGIGYASNLGLEKAKAEYIYYTQGDILPAKGNIMQMYEWMLEHPEVDFLCVNAWVAQKETEEVELVDYHTIGMQGLGNFAYANCIFKRAILEAGVRFPQDGPFKGPGAGFEDAEFAQQMWSKGFKAYMFNAPKYFHELRRGRRSGIEDEQAMLEKERERKRYLSVRWNKIGFDITHHQEQPPERHLRRVAVMANHFEGHLAPAEFMAMNLRKIGCVAHQFNSLENPYLDKDEGNRLVRQAYPVGYFDNFLFIDDGDLKYWECPQWAHPSTFWAIDFYYPTHWPYANEALYLGRMKTFDEVFTPSVGAVKLCQEHGINAKLLLMAGDDDFHKPYPEEKKFDWVALWNNVDNRAKYAAAAFERFPSGCMGYFEGESYPRTMSQSNCIINLCRISEYNMRVPEAMLCGVPLITDRVDNIGLYFKEGEHYLGHSTMEEMLDQIQWVKDHPEESRQMADRARKLALKEHTYYKRLLQMWGGVDVR